MFDVGSWKLDVRPLDPSVPFTKPFASIRVIRGHHFFVPFVGFCKTLAIRLDSA